MSDAASGADLLLDALREIEQADTNLRMVEFCKDPQCGDSTWDHDCGDVLRKAPGPSAVIARRALDAFDAMRWDGGTPITPIRSGGES